MTETSIRQLSEKVSEYVFAELIGDLSDSEIFERLVPTHYGASHLGAALILLGERSEDEFYSERGQKIIRQVLTTWKEHSSKEDFHFDFNNFALAVVLKCSTSIDSSLLTSISRHLIDNIQDSNHNTVNWLPMRRFVNSVRLELKETKLFRRRIDKIDALIRSATNNDGGIEDQLPYGVSYNLQYNISSVAGMLFNSLMGNEKDLSKQLGFLLDKALPDGDINYLGRGANQIFAWGPWFYILSSCSFQNDSSYLESRLDQMLRNKNLMLNDYNGKEKFQWYDYHHFPVYISHFLFWLVLSKLHLGKGKIEPVFVDNQSTGLTVKSNAHFSISTFTGRKGYSTEYGPSISAIYSAKYGILSKGMSGPDGGTFGIRYSYPAISNLNHIGLVEVKNRKKSRWSNIIRFLTPETHTKLINLYLMPSIDFNDDKLIVKYDKLNARQLFFSFISFIPLKEYEYFSFVVNNHSVRVSEVATIKTQFGWAHVIQSNMFLGANCELRIK